MSASFLVAFIVVFSLIILDYITGVVYALLAHTLTSEKMRAGLGHKFTYFVVLMVSGIFQYACKYIDFGFGSSVSLFIPCAVGVSLIEVTSILENCLKINPDLASVKVLNIFKREDV